MRFPDFSSLIATFKPHHHGQNLIKYLKIYLPELMSLLSIFGLLVESFTLLEPTLLLMKQSSALWAVLLK